MRIVAGVALLALGGCLQVPVQVLDTKTAADVPLRGNYVEASRCVRGAAIWTPGTYSTVLSSDQTRTSEVLFKNSADQLLGIVEISERGQGSRGLVRAATNTTESARLGQVIEGLRACS
jgi:hypothetical protein